MEVRFLSQAEGRAYAIRKPAPAVSDRVCVGSSPDVWLVTADACSELHLLNPVTGAQVPLLSAATLPFVDATRGADGSVESYSLRCCFPDADDCVDGQVVIPPETLAPNRLRYEVYEKAIVVSAPRQWTTPSGETWGAHAVALICQPLSRLAVARAGDAGWTLLDTPARCWVDAVRAAGADGVVYAMDTAGRVEAWDMDASPASFRAAIAPPCRCSAHGCAMSAACRRYLVELAPGHLLQVHRLRIAAHAGYTWEPRPEHVEYTTTGVELFEWKAGGNESSDLPRGHRWTARPPAASWPRGRCSWGRARRCASRWIAAAAVDAAEGQPHLLHRRWAMVARECHEVAPDVGVLDLADGSYRPPRSTAQDLLWKWPSPVWVFPSIAS